MPAGSGGGCCCGWNVAKVDPSTGAIALTTAVIGDGTISNPSAVRIQPLRGTNDILVAIQAASSPASSQLCRVDNTGAPVWCITGLAVVPSTGLRRFGSDGTYIVAQTPTGLAGYDYSGSPQWTLTLANITAINVGPSGTYSSNTTSPQQRKYDSSNGSVITTAVNSNDCNPQAVDQSSGSIYINNTILGGGQILNSTYGFVRSIAFNSRINCRWGGAGVTYASGSGGGLFNPSTGGLVWSNSNFGGDTDSDGTGCYATQAVVSGTTYSLGKYNSSTGATIWGAVQFSAAGIRGVAVAGGGWIYVGGTWTV